jgi:hypothetical protein
MEHTMSIAGKWGYSEDGEYYSGALETQAEAIAEGFAVSESDSLEIGRYRAPERLRIDWRDVVGWKCPINLGRKVVPGVLPTPQQTGELMAAIEVLRDQWERAHGLSASWVVVDPATVEVVTRDDASTAESAGV